MSIGEKFDAAEKVAAGTPQGVDSKKSTGPSLKEILADKEQSSLFGDYLERENEVDLAKKLAEGDLDQDEIERLGELRRGFSETVQESRAVLNSFDRATIHELVASSSELRKLTEVFGDESVIQEALARHVVRMGVRDPFLLKSLQTRINQKDAAKGALEAEEVRGRMFCKRFGISEDQYVQLLRSGDSQEVAKTVHSRLGFLKRRFTSPEDIQNQVDAAVNGGADALRNAIADSKQDIRALGDGLAALLVDNDVLREAMVAELRGTRPPTENSMGFSELRPPNQNDVKEAWDKEKKKKKFSTTQDEDSAKDAFAKQYAAEHYKNKKGFWASIFEEIFTNMVRGSL